MTRPIGIPIGITRCPSTRTVPCGVADDCARARADSTGRMTQDFSIEPRGVGGCVYHLTIGQFRQAAASPGPRVHEPVRGLS